MLRPLNRRTGLQKIEQARHLPHPQMLPVRVGELARDQFVELSHAVGEELVVEPVLHRGLELSIGGDAHCASSRTDVSGAGGSPNPIIDVSVLNWMTLLMVGCKLIAARMAVAVFG